MGIFFLFQKCWKTFIAFHDETSGEIHTCHAMPVGKWESNEESGGQIIKDFYASRRNSDPSLEYFRHCILNNEKNKRPEASERSSPDRQSVYSQSILASSSLIDSHLISINGNGILVSDFRFGKNRKGNNDDLIRQERITVHKWDN